MLLHVTNFIQQRMIVRYLKDLRRHEYLIPATGAQQSQTNHRPSTHTRRTPDAPRRPSSTLPYRQTTMHWRAAKAHGSMPIHHDSWQLADE